MVKGEKPPKDKGIDGGSSTENYKVDSWVDLPAYTCEGSSKLKEHARLLRLMQFLMGLNDVFNSVRSTILTIKHIPDVKFAFTTLYRDESHINSHSSSKSVKVGPSAFAAMPSDVCKYCNMTGHTIDRFYGLVSYPPGFKKGNMNQNNVNNVNFVDDKIDHSKSTAHTLTSDQYQRLMSLLSTCNTSNTHANVADTPYPNTLTNSRPLPDFEEYDVSTSAGEITETMTETTIEEYMTRTREDYGSGVTRPKFNKDAKFELKGQFIKELRDYTFSGLENKDANEHIERVLEIVDLFATPYVTQDQLMLRVFSIIKL
nr:ribonuclease H-like domain-containing protein [Tanacetum cinerariifolium]